MSSYSTFLQPWAKGLSRIKGQKGPPDLEVRVRCRQKHDIIPFSKLSHIILKPLSPDTLTTPCFVFILARNNGFPPFFILLHVFQEQQQPPSTFALLGWKSQSL